MKSQYEHIIHPFPPLYDNNSKILILGSLPSVKSREQMFFYGHPQNRFWKVITAVINNSGMNDKNIEVPVTIEDKKHSQTGENPRYKLSAITTYNQRNGVLTIGNKSHKLKGKDMRLLQLLCLHFNEWVSPKELSFGLWGMEKNIGELKRYIGHLRQELSEDPALSIENKHGGYYKLQGE